MTDPIADMLTRIRNAQQVGKKEVVIPLSKMKLEIARILKENGYILDFTEDKDQNKFGQINISLKYDNRTPHIRDLKRISRPGCRIYAKKDALPKVLGDQGIAIISTSLGLMSNKEARKRSLGGEVLCEIY